MCFFMGNTQITYIQMKKAVNIELVSTFKT